MSALARVASVAVVAAACAIALLACGTRAAIGDQACGSSPPMPSATTVLCDAGAPGSSGCVGLPPDPWAPDAHSSHLDQTYPQGCTVEFPHANPYYQCSPQTCSCGPLPLADGGTTPGWTCPL